MLGERLKFLRQQTNKTQQQIADKLGITRAAYSHFENDRNQPDSDTIVRLAELFEVSTDYLLGRDEKKPVQDPNLLVAAHIDDDVSDEDMEDILRYIEYRKKNPLPKK